MALRLACRRLLPVAALLLAQAIAPARADVVTEWNAIALGVTAVPPNAAYQSRALAIMHGAIYDTVQAIERKGAAYAVDIAVPPGASLEAAVAAAAHRTLVRLVPAQRDALDAVFKATLARIADGPGKADGVRLGTDIAEKFLDLRRGDGWDAKANYAPKAGPGHYQPTPPHHPPPVLPHWGGVTPFLLQGRNELAFKGAPAPGSAAFARDFAEVKSLGARHSTTRSADQTAAAIFWTVLTAVPWNDAARAASASRRLSVSENARLFAILAMATADSQIVAFREKYDRPHWRPITAIRAAASLGIAGLEGDPHWEPLVVTPFHPDYPSGHSIFSGAAEAVLRAYFGSDEVEVSVTFPAPFGVMRSYRSFSAMAEECAQARTWGGIHFASANRDGLEVGRRIGTLAIRDFPKPAREP